MNLKNTLEMLKKPQSKAYILTVAGIVFIIIAIFLIASNEFWYNLESIDYYESQYNYTKSMSSGFFGSDYRYLASEWKELYDEAITYVVCHIIGAIISSTVGGIGLYKGIKNVKKLKKSSNEHDSN